MTLSANQVAKLLHIGTRSLYIRLYRGDKALAECVLKNPGSNRLIFSEAKVYAMLGLSGGQQQCQSTSARLRLVAQA